MSSNRGNSISSIYDIATGSINDRFEAAYQSRRADLNKVVKKR